MSSDFITVPRPKTAPKGTSPAALAQEWFASARGIAPDTVARLRGEVQRRLEAGACKHLLPKMPTEHLAGAELQRCVEQVMIGQWDSLTPEERLLTRFPTVQAVGEEFEIPNRGKGLIIRRELTLWCGDSFPARGRLILQMGVH